MKKANPDEEEFFDKEEQEIYDIITGKVRYPAQPFRDEDVRPDLVIKIKVPNNQYVSRNAYLTLSNIMSSPSQRLERAYARAEKVMAREMEVNKENLDPLNLKLRLQMAIKTISPPNEKSSKIINQHQEEEALVLDCVHQFIGLLDSFSLLYNTILYMLQRICGFRVKAFILYDKQVTERHIYLFLSLSTKNLLRVANRYRIKKEAQYTHFDFYLNNPTTSDLRPIRLHSKFITDRQNVTQLKHISRYFKTKEAAAHVKDIIEEVELGDGELDNFRSCNEELHIVYEYLKYKRNPKLTNNEKMYLFEYNRRKLNPGVQKFYTTLKKRKEFFDVSKEILPKYGYDSFQQPVVFQEFSLPDKNSRGATFFNKLESILLYKPLVCQRDGKLTLFLNMQRTKLSYMLLKQHFKIGYLPLIGADVFALQNFFDKYGAQDPTGDIHGGLDGKCLVQNWNPYSLFSDIKVIRNYMGQRVAYQILYNNYIIGYMVSIIIPYVIFFVLEQVFAESVWLYTSTLEAVLYAVSYSAFMFYWESAEEEFIKNYCDAVESKVFLSKFRGPYMRNILSDQANQFRNPIGMSSYIRNFLCFILIVAMLVVLGAIFFGFRMMLVEIYEPLSAYQIGGALSLPHLIAYALFFIVEEGFRLVVDKVISFMVYLQNPPSDEDERRWEDTLTFFYLLAIEMIPPFFMLILEPFNSTSCYANSCESELSLYIYSRYVFVVGVVAVRLLYVILFSYIKKNLQRLLSSKVAPRIFFQDKLAAMLKQAINDSNKPQHKEKKMDILTSLQNYATYCTLLPISPAIVFLGVFIHFFSMRLSLIGDQRRPLNRSESIIRFSNQLGYIYYLGILMNTWVNVYLLQFVEWNFQDVIFTVATEVSEQGIFLLKIFTVIIYSIILLLLGKIGYMVARSASENVLNLRKDFKFKDYQHSRGGLKITLKKVQEMTPLKSVFRIFNPDETYDEMLERLQKEVDKDKGQSLDELGAGGSATSLEKKI